MESLHLIGELVFNENATLWRSEICTTLSEGLLVKQLMNDTDARSPFNRDSDHTGDVVEVALREAFRAVQRIDPDYHVVFVELVWELQLITLVLGSCDPIYLLHVF